MQGWWFQCSGQKMCCSTAPKFSTQYFDLRASGFNIRKRPRGRAETSHGVKGNLSASHDSYMRELGVLDQRRYPGFSEHPIAAFHDLAHDLSLADDFLSGSAAVLCKAAARESSDTFEQNTRLTAGYVGDVRQRQELHERFREGNYGRVIALSETLKYMTDSEHRMVEIARKRALS